MFPLRPYGASVNVIREERVFMIRSVSRELIPVVFNVAAG